MFILSAINKHPGKFMLLCLILPILWFCRSFFPMVFLWGEKIEITFTLPENIEVDYVRAGYFSNKCQTYSVGTAKFLSASTKHQFKPKKIDKNTYKVDVYFKENLFCQWQLEDIFWRVKYKDISKVYPELFKHNDKIKVEFPGAGEDLYKWGDGGIKEGGTEKYVKNDYLMPKYIVDRSWWPSPYDTLVIDRIKLIYNGEFGLKTRYINYNLVEIQAPPFTTIKRVKTSEEKKVINEIWSEKRKLAEQEANNAN